LNPGGSPDLQAADTIGRQIDDVLTQTVAEWSAYCDESWLGRKAGEATFQKRVRHLLARLGLDPRRTPSSNLIFVRSSRLATLDGGIDAHVTSCWKFHEQVIARLATRVVICLGVSTGEAVRQRTGADRPIAVFEEANARRWKSSLHCNDEGLLVASLTHPSIADWTTPGCDPSPLLLDRV
jgi:hypothetical protein